MYNYPTVGTLLFLDDTETKALDHAKSLLLENSPRSAALLTAHSHPDFFVIKPEAKSHWIKIDQIRDLIEWAQSKPQISSRKVALISPADVLNIQSANALLKTLEEPAEDCVFILVCQQINSIPLTIRSRCHIIRNHSTENAQNRTVFNKSKIDNENTRISDMIKKHLIALQANQINLTSISEIWAKQELKCVLKTWYEVLLNDIKTQNITGQLNITSKLWYFIDQLNEVLRTTSRQNPPNAQLAIDTLLINYNNIN